MPPIKPQSPEICFSLQNLESFQNEEITLAFSFGALSAFKLSKQITSYHVRILQDAATIVA
jgi:hypothetical protein